MNKKSYCAKTERKRQLFALNIVLLTTLLASAALAQTASPPSLAASATSQGASSARPQPLSKLIGSALRQERLLVGRTELALSKLRHLYKVRVNEPAFTTPQGPNERAAELKNLIIDARTRGLNASHYWSRELDRLWNLRDQVSLVQLELLMSNALIKFASDAATGRVDPELEFGTPRMSRVSPFSDPAEIKFKKRPFGPQSIAALNDILTSGRTLEEGLSELEPQSGEYQALKLLAAKLVRLEASDAWRPIALSQKVLKLGMQDPAVPLIRARLVDLGYLAEEERAVQGFTYDPTLVHAIKVFQFNTKQAFSVEKVELITEEKPLPASEDFSPKAMAYRNNVPPADGVIGPRVLGELNRSLTERLDKIAVNLEKWRWLPREIGSRYIFVNTARQELQVIENGAPVIEMNVVVGKILRRTPSMLTALNGLVINPTWTAPIRNIVVDILPNMTRDPNYLEKEGMVVLKDGVPIKDAATAVRWSVYSETTPPPYRFVQLAGIKSSLGNVKFNLDNPDSIFMHDWAYDHDHISKFYTTERFASSGCVRLSRPRELLEYVLRDFSPDEASTYLTSIDENLVEVPSEERFKRRITTFSVPVPQQIPVVIANMTATFDSANRVQFAPDYYGQDEMILNALQ